LGPRSATQASLAAGDSPATKTRLLFQVEGMDIKVGIEGLVAQLNANWTKVQERLDALEKTDENFVNVTLPQVQVHDKEFKETKEMLEKANVLNMKIKLDSAEEQYLSLKAKLDSAEEKYKELKDGNELKLNQLEDKVKQLEVNAGKTTKETTTQKMQEVLKLKVDEFDGVKAEYAKFAQEVKDGLEKIHTAGDAYANNQDNVQAKIMEEVGKHLGGLQQHEVRLKSVEDFMKASGAAAPPGGTVVPPPPGIHECGRCPAGGVMGHMLVSGGWSCHCKCVDSLITEAARMNGALHEINGRVGIMQHEVEAVKNHLKAQDAAGATAPTTSPTPTPTPTPSPVDTWHTGGQDPWNGAQGAKPPGGQPSPGGQPGGTGGPPHGGPGGDGGPPNGGPGGPGGSAYDGTQGPWRGAGAKTETVTWRTNLFDAKVAVNDKYRYNGVDKGDSWKRSIEGFFVGRCPQVEGMLQWAERQGTQVIDKNMIDAAHATGKFGIMTEDYEVLAGHIWSFLQICCVDGAATIFQNCRPNLNGLEVWRALTWEINSGRGSRLGGLQEYVAKPPAVRRYQDISGAITAFDCKLQELAEAGGERPQDITLKRALLQSFPNDLREALVLRASDVEEPFAVFKRAVRTKIAFILECGGGRNASANLLEDEGVENDMEAMLAKITDLDDDMKVEILAMYQQCGRPGGRPQRGRPGAPKGFASQRPAGVANFGAANSAKTLRCTMCGATGHTRDKCTKGFIAPNLRPCFECGKPGHQKKDCPLLKRKQQQANYLEPEEEVFTCFACEVEPTKSVNKEGYVKVPNRSGRPMPRAPTLADFLTDQNRLKILGEENDSVNSANAMKAQDDRAPFVGSVCSLNSSTVHMHNRSDDNSLADGTGLPQAALKANFTLDESNFLGIPEASGAAERRVRRRKAKRRRSKVIKADAIESSGESTDSDMCELMDSDDDVGELYDKLRFTSRLNQCRNDCPCNARHDNDSDDDDDGFDAVGVFSHGHRFATQRDNCPAGTQHNDGCASDDSDKGRASSPMTVLDGRGSGGSLPLKMAAGPKPFDEIDGTPRPSQGRVEHLRDTVTRFQHTIARNGTVDVRCLDVEQSSAQLLATQPSAIRSRVIRVALDSGAGDHVASPEDVEGFSIVPSEYSRAGRSFVAANGGKIANHGEATVKMRSQKGKKLASTFQVAQVTRPLYSVSKLCDAGYDVSFSRADAVVRKNGETVHAFKREGGLYVAEMMIGEDAERPASDFVRQGGRA